MTANMEYCVTIQMENYIQNTNEKYTMQMGYYIIQIKVIEYKQNIIQINICTIQMGKIEYCNV